MAPGGTFFRFTPHFGENVLLYGSHKWLPYSKDEVRLKTVNNNLSFQPEFFLFYHKTQIPAIPGFCGLHWEPFVIECKKYA